MSYASPYIQGIKKLKGNLISFDVIIHIKNYYAYHIYICCVLIIVMEKHLTLTLTSDHINNVRNEFLRSNL